MFAFFFVLACLAHTGCARRLHTKSSAALPYDDQNPWPSQNATSSLQSLAEISESNGDENGNMNDNSTELHVSESDEPDDVGEFGELELDAEDEDFSVGDEEKHPLNDLKMLGMLLLALKLSFSPLKMLGIFILTEKLGWVDMHLEEPLPNKETTIGAAAVGGAIGLHFFQGWKPSVILSLIVAYVSTMDSNVGSLTKTAGNFAARSYHKAVEVSEEHKVFLKAKSAMDTLLTTADAFNIGVALNAAMSRIIEWIKSLQAVRQATSKLQDINNSVKQAVTKRFARENKY